jgi:hypothetical protein
LRQFRNGTEKCIGCRRNLLICQERELDGALRDRESSSRD